MKLLEQELELSTRAVLASENWASTYQNAPVQHAALIKNVAKMHTQVLLYFRDLAKRAPNMVDWYSYTRAQYEQGKAMRTSSILAYDVDVIINNDAVGAEDQAFIKILFDTVASTIALGVDSMEVEFAKHVGLTSTSAIIQDLTTNQLANLVGMKVVDKGLPTEHIIPNPNPIYNIDDTTRTRIANSIKTSIQIGENHAEAVKRLQEVIADANRADMIAYTETVRAYGEGRRQYAEQSQATGKYNTDSLAIDECAGNTAEGIIPRDQDFSFGGPCEPFHIRCKCLTTYVYGEAGVDFAWG